MKIRYNLLAFLTSFSLGLILPVQSLLFIAHGCTLQTMGLAFGIYAAAVITAEVPTGVFADIFGRKTAFLTSVLLSAASCIVLLFSASFAVVAAGLLLMGLGVAFASGSADALIIEETLAESGEQRLHGVIGTLRVSEAAGLMAGALAGGFVPFSQGYSLHLIIRIALNAVLFVFALSILKESRPIGIKSPPIRAHLAHMGRTLLGRKILMLILFCIAAFGFVQFMLETYWQPRLAEISAGKAQVLLGFLSASGFGATAVGSFLVTRIQAKSTSSSWRMYLLSAFVITTFIALLSFQVTRGGFSAVYIIIYLTIGMLTVFEQTLINQSVTDSVRASMLSLTSFAARGGGVLSSLIGAALISGMSISGVWRTGAVMTAVCLFSVAVLYHTVSKNQSI